MPGTHWPALSKNGKNVPMHELQRRPSLLLAASTLCLALTACRSGPRAVSIDPAAYAGPEIRITPGSRTHIVSFTAPTGGWSLTLDTVRDEFEKRRAFITIIAPGTTELTTQALVEHTLDSQVSLLQNLEVYVRTAARDEPMPGSYRLAGSAAAPAR